MRQKNNKSQKQPKGEGTREIFVVTGSFEIRDTCDL